MENVMRHGDSSIAIYFDENIEQDSDKLNAFKEVAKKYEVWIVYN